jgi:hypothetical protein
MKEKKLDRIEKNENNLDHDDLFLCVHSSNLEIFYVIESEKQK